VTSRVHFSIWPNFKFLFTFFKNELYFSASFRLIEKLGGRYRDFPYIPCPQVCPTPPSIISSTRLVYLIQLMTLCWPIITIHSPLFTCELTLGVVYSMSLNSCIMIYIYHYIIIKNTFTLLKISLLPLLSLSAPLLLLSCGTHWSFYRLHSFAFSRMSSVIVHRCHDYVENPKESTSKKWKQAGGTASAVEHLTC
jgi:hypothetical protein